MASTWLPLEVASVATAGCPPVRPLEGADTELGNYRTLGKCHLARRSLECPFRPVGFLRSRRSAKTGFRQVKFHKAATGDLTQPASCRPSLFQCHVGMMCALIARSEPQRSKEQDAAISEKYESVYSWVSVVSLWSDNCVLYAPRIPAGFWRVCL